MFGDTDIDELFDQIDADSSGEIDYMEFLVAASNTEDLMTPKTLNVVFDHLNVDGDGEVTGEELKALFDDNCDFTTDDLKILVAEADTNGDGVLSREEFLALFQQ